MGLALCLRAGRNVHRYSTLPASPRVVRPARSGYGRAFHGQQPLLSQLCAHGLQQLAGALSGCAQPVFLVIGIPSAPVSCTIGWRGWLPGSGFYTYPAAWLGLVTIIFVMGLLIVIRRIHLRQSLLVISVFLTAIALTAGPRFVYGASSENAEPLFYKLIETSFVSSFYGSAFYGPAELYPEGVAYLLGNNQIFYAPEVYIELLARGSVRTLAALFDPFIVTEHFLTTNFAGGFLAAIGLALGLGLCLRTIKQTRSILLLTWLGAGLFFLSIIAAFPPRHTHLVTIIPVLALLSALGFAVSADTLASELAKRWSPALTKWVQKGLIVAVSSMLLFSGMREYFITMPIRNPPLFEDIVSWIAWRNEEPFNIIYLDSTEKTPHRVEYHVNTGDGSAHLRQHIYL